MKRLFSLVAAMLMIVSTVTTAFAVEIQPRYEPCPNCNKGFIQETTTEVGDPLRQSQSRVCIHGKNGQDTVFLHTYQVTYYCTTCHYETGYTYTKPLWHCEGKSY